MNELLSKDDYAKILAARFKNQKVELVNANLAPLSEDVEGYMGQHFILKLTYKTDETENTESFFIKAKPNQSEIQKELATTFNTYPKEIFVFEFLFKEFERMGYNTTFAPKGYHCTKDETIVMDDLSNKGFRPCGKRTFFDLDYCKTSLKALAYFHANCIAYEETRSKEMGKSYRIIDEKPEVFTEMFFILNEPKGGVSKKYNDCTNECYMQLLKYVDESQDWKDSFIRRLNNFKYVELFWKDLPSRKTCTHGDLWSNNMLFKYTNNVPTECCLVDFQIMRHHHSAYDVILNLYSNTRRDFRKKHYDELLRYYYDTFEEILKENGYDAAKILPWRDFMHVADYMKPIAMYQGAGTRTLTLLPAEVTNKAVNFDQGGLEAIYFTDRPRMVLEACEIDEELKNIMIDDVYDLNENI